MGKSLRIKRMAEMIQRVSIPGKKYYINVPVCGPDVSERSILELVKDGIQTGSDTYPQLIHFNLHLSHTVSLHDEIKN